jgi:FkbM family methyltransferase
MIPNNRHGYKLAQCGYADCAPCNLHNYERREIGYVTSYLDRLHAARQLHGVFVDVGAHTGLWSLAMSIQYQDRYLMTPCIYAFEPDIANYSKLQQTAAQPHTGIIPVRSAVWNRPGTLAIVASDNPSRHYVTADAPSNETVQVTPGVTIDSLTDSAEKRQMIDAIKIDVEGSELLVLNGAKQTLIDATQLLLVVEYSIEHLARYDNKPQQVTAFLQAYGYVPVRDEDREVTSGKLPAGAVKRVIFVKGDIV